ncbi:DUF4383 domain-containing protein [Capilliphycus salinus ALCB114379]|uniref:DUF4383 domain-containing protein n=1 Tax=Capilliphycus salinus TaxID=2768948 RepID=UPI0039A56310
MNNNSMPERYCALSIGIVFLLLGIAGFIPGLVTMPDPTNIPADLYPATEGLYTRGFGYLFGLFPINTVHNAVHIVVGALGIVSYIGSGSARLFNRDFAVAYILIAVMGLLPFTRTTFGLMPIFGNNVWFNAATGLVAAYFGFVKPIVESDEPIVSNRSNTYNG